MAELSDWLTSFSVDPALASSPLSAERRLSDVPSKQLASFACVMNAQERFNDRYLDMYCFINDTMWMWQYPSGSLSNQTEDIIDHCIYTLWQLDEGRLTLTRQNRLEDL